MLNNVTLQGRFVHDPELRHTQSNVAVASFSLAVERDAGQGDDGKRPVDFVDCVAWRNTGEFIAQYFKKGAMVLINGQLQMRRYTDRDGNKRTAMEVNVAKAYFCGDRKADAQVDPAAYTGPVKVEYDAGDTDLPF